LKPLAEKLWRHCEAKEIAAKTVTVKIKYSDFTQATRSNTSALPFADGNSIFEAASSLLATVYPFKRSVRLLGITLSSLTIWRDGPAEQAQPQLDFNQ
jgi:DNA polymerase-4